MIEKILIELVPQYGGLAVVALFAFLMLKAQMKALENLNGTLANHFQADLESQKQNILVLTEIKNTMAEVRKSMESLEERAEKRHGEQREWQK